MLLCQQRWVMLFVQQCRMVLQFWTNLLNLFKRPLNLYDFRSVILFFPGDQLDGLHFHFPGAGLNDSQSDGNVTQDEIIDHGNHDDEDNLQLSALQEYINMIDDDGEESGEDT